jgi:GT2 family glycosyltransferase
VLADGSLHHLGQGDWKGDAPELSYLRQVDFCSSLFMVTRRSAFENAGGFDMSVPAGPYRDADFGFRLRRLGYLAHSQPESVGVCSRRLSRALAVAPAGGSGDRRAFATRWRRLLLASPIAAAGQTGASRAEARA